MLNAKTEMTTMIELGAGFYLSFELEKIKDYRK